ncbi:MAG TPA: Gfo/Idh/MocA family oxidoreductase, partial [Candidatus Tectomicrobia bacterium]
MGRYHVGVLAELPQVDLVGIVDIEPQRVQPLAETYNTSALTDYRELLGEVDVVTIAVPTVLHYQVAREFLDAGVHVLIEKPIAPTLAEAEELFEVADQRGVMLHVGHVERFNGAVQELKNIVRDPILIECRRMGPFQSRAKDDGVVLDLMIHDLDIVLNLVGCRAHRIRAVGAAVLSDVEDVANVQLWFDNGCLATITASRATQEKIRTLAVTQREEYILLNYTDQDIRIFRQGSSEHRLGRGELRYKQEALIERIFVHKDNPLKLELKHLLDCATHQATRMVSAEDELYSLQVTLEIIEMIR